MRRLILCALLLSCAPAPLQRDPMRFVPSQIDAAMRQGVSDAQTAREVWR